MNEREELRKLFLDHPSASMPGLMEFSSTVPEDVEDVDSIIDLILAAGFRRQPETEWEYGVGYEAYNGVEMRWFSMGGASYTVREAAENEVTRFHDPQVRLVRRAKPDPWAPVEGEVR